MTFRKKGPARKPYGRPLRPAPDGRTHPPAPAGDHLTRVCLGGTFDPFHIGHEALLDRALLAAGKHGHVFVGLVSDAYSATKRQRQVASLRQRTANLERFFDARRALGRVDISPLDDPHGPSSSGAYDAIVVSVETQRTAGEINRRREAAGLRPLEVIIVPHVVGADLLPVSGTRIAAGRIDRMGKRLVPLVVAVGSRNPVKRNATAAAFRRFVPGVEVSVVGVRARSGVPEQPFGDDTARGARSRARDALEASTSDGAEYGVGIEAGLVRDTLGGGWFDVQHCIIVDTMGHETHGHGPGFHHPSSVVARVLHQGETIGEALGALAGDPDLGTKVGAVGWLTDGRLDRTRLTESAVESALVPRVRRALYETGARR